MPDSLLDKLGIATAKRTYKAYRNLLSSAREQPVYDLGGPPQGLL
ncbi:MAG TPA: hypothetical protein VHZ55_10495 [Bryobacteraceae bacterium]|nr:hypothetical protein [Bryobacteraceae bacterium]